MLNKAYSENQITSEKFLDFTANQKDNNRYELINGYIYLMSSPSLTHQRIAGYIYRRLSDYFAGRECEVFIAPFDVYLFDAKSAKSSCRNVLQPDVFVVCDKNKIAEHGCEGAPDFVVEVVSKSTSNNDYILKLNNYMRFGVKEYWIVNPLTGQVSVYLNDIEAVDVHHYNFSEIIRTNIFDGLSIRLDAIPI